MINAIIKRILIGVSALALAGCSGNPTAREIETQVKDQLVASVGSELFQVENFAKTNGFTKDDKTYIADVRYDLVFKKKIKELTADLDQQTRQGSLLGTLGSAAKLLALQVQYGNFEAGQRVTKEESAETNPAPAAVAKNIKNAVRRNFPMDDEDDWTEAW